MESLPGKDRSQAAFTFAELCVAIAVGVLFGAAVFATNSRLLVALKAQKESTAATMVLQQRMESLRGCSFTQVATDSYLQNNIFNTPTGSEGPLASLNEQVAVGVYGNPSVTPIVLLRNPQNPTTPQELSTNNNLAEPSRDARDRQAQQRPEAAEHLPTQPVAVRSGLSWFFCRHSCLTISLHRCDKRAKGSSNEEPRATDRSKSVWLLLL
jgi:hypothetical protein